MVPWVGLSVNVAFPIQPHNLYIYIGLVYKYFERKIVIIFLPTNLTYILGAQKNRHLVVSWVV